MPPKRHRRTAEQIIADLQAEIERIKARAVEQKARKDPALRHISSALRAIDKALGETKDKATRTAPDTAEGLSDATKLYCKMHPHTAARHLDTPILMEDA